MKRSIFIVFAAVLGAMPLIAQGLRAAAVKVDITPQSPQWLMGYAPRKSTGVHDRIFHRIIAIDDGTTQIYIASSDLCLFSPEVYDEVAEDLERETGIARKQFWWTVTHTHSAPEIGPPGVYKSLLKGRSDHEWDREYTKLVKDSLITAVKQSRSAPEPARLLTGSGTSNANINRRAKDFDGTISLGLNPDGPVDRQIGLIRLEKPDGTPIALAVNYALHGTVLSGQNQLISGDAPGIVSAYLEDKLGGVVAFLNGAAGNAAPIYSVYPDPKAGHLGEFRVLLGDHVLEANAHLSPVSDTKLQLDEIVVETPLKAGLEWPSELSRYSRVDASGHVLVRLPVRFLRIGDTMMWSAPVELFSEISIKIRSQSPFMYTFYAGYTNGWFGYLPAARAFAEGGYEPATSPFTEAAEQDLTRQVIGTMQKHR
jgi:neutral ceramidase